MKIRTLMLATALIAFAAGGVANAETTRTTTMTSSVDVPGVKKFDIESFDDNKDNIVTINETGDHLFHLFDLDSNGVLDNIEFTKKTVLTIIPLKSETFTFRDFDDDGKMDAGKYAYSTYIKKSGLAMFDQNRDGLSPDDFVNASFLEMDHNNSHVVEPDEWRTAYIQSRLPEAAKQYRYNN